MTWRTLRVSLPWCEDWRTTATRALTVGCLCPVSLCPCTTTSVRSSLPTWTTFAIGKNSEWSISLHACPSYVSSLCMYTRGCVCACVCVYACVCMCPILTHCLSHRCSTGGRGKDSQRPSWHSPWSARSQGHQLPEEQDVLPHLLLGHQIPEHTLRTSPSRTYSSLLLHSSWAPHRTDRPDICAVKTEHDFKFAVCSPRVFLSAISPSLSSLLPSQKDAFCVWCDHLSSMLS